MLIGALEAGGTKMVCAVGKEDGSVLEQVSIPTTTPEETIPQILDYFKSKEIGALGSPLLVRWMLSPLPLPMDLF